MAISLRNGVGLGRSCEFGFRTRENCFLWSSGKVAASKNEFNCRRKRIELKGQIRSAGWKLCSGSSASNHVENPVEVNQSNRWWEVGSKDNFREIVSAQGLVDSLLNAGDKLVVVHFYSPLCGGCRPLHPKVYQIAAANQGVIFLNVNQDVHKLLCKTLRVHVLPFFHFYRGAQGRMCSFSCTVATIKKLKDALEKHGNEQCSLGPAKGLEEGEFLNLASNKEIESNHPPDIAANHEDPVLYAN